MTRTILIIAMAVGLGGIVEAYDLPLETWKHNQQENQEAEERERRSNPYVVNIATKSKSGLYGDWVIIKSSEIWTLDEFISSGRFCLATQGHQWRLAFPSEICRGNVSNFGYICPVCGNCRKRIRVQREEIEWEP